MGALNIQSIKTGVGLSVLCLLAFALRYYFATEKSIGFDEWITYTTSLGILHPESSLLFNPKTVVTAAHFKQAIQQLPLDSTGSLTNILKALENDLNLPAYFVLMGTWLKMVSQFSPLLLRLPSILMNVACIPALVFLGRQLAVPKTGWMCALLFAIVPYAIFYGTDARPYSLIILLALIGSIGVLRLLGGQQVSLRHWVTIIGCFWMGLLTHYFFGLTALVWTLMLVLRRDKCKRLWLWLIAAWLPPLLVSGLILKTQLNGLNGMNPLKAALSVPAVLGYLFKGLFSVFFLYSPFSDIVTMSLSLLISLSVLFGIYQLCQNRESALKTPLFQFCGLWMLIHGVGLLFVSVLFQSRILDVPRYWVFVLPALFLVAGHWLTWGTVKARVLKSLLGVFALLLIGLRFYKEQGYADFNYRQVSDVIQANQTSTDVVLTAAGYPTAAALGYYLPASTHMATQFTPGYFESGNERLAKLTGQTKRVWFCASFNQFPQKVYLDLLNVLTHQQGFVQKQSLVTSPQPLILLLLERHKAQ